MSVSENAQGTRNEILARNRSSAGDRLLRALRTPSGGVFILLIALLIAVIAANPSFGEPGSLIRFIGRTAPIAIAAIGQYFVIVSGEFDLSMGSVVTAQVFIAGNLIGDDDARVLPVLGLMFVFGAFIGLINGLVTTLLKVPSFIVTLGMMLALLGMVLYSTGGAATGNPADSFRQIGRGGIRDVPVLEIIPYPVIIFVVTAAAALWLMRRPYGRTLIAVGDNSRAAALTGARVWWVKTRAFMLSSLSATVAGIILVGYAGVHPSVGRGYEFTAITAVVLGGVVLGGGRGWVLSAAAGAFALETLFTLLNFLGVESTWRDSVQGIIIIVAVAAAAQTWQRKRRGASSRTHEPTHPIAPPPTVGTNERGI
ncbi:MULTISPECIES: ABC transporter permease [unclassified Arthrobacter]|uniref:ABC transporter permease n=1 Tax=unclassified Arthrobacter TaxID=235627 RepID=UPI0014908CF7|nr:MULTISPECIES: ABC transporter permease [unclassified Arthrobacter]